VLTAVPRSIREIKRRYGLERADNCAWVEIPVTYHYNLLVGNYHFEPDCDVKIIEDYLKFLE
jgi:hypothetical protein